VAEQDFSVFGSHYLGFYVLFLLVHHCTVLFCARQPYWVIYNLICLSVHM